MTLIHLFRAVVAVVAASAALPATADTNPLKDPKYCGSCHTRIFEEWKSSAMGEDLENPKVFQFYTGTNAKGEKDGMGYQGMHPGKAGDCADCHVPQLVIDEHKQGREVDLGVAMKDKLDHGLSCNFCHTVEQVRLEKDAEGRYDTRIFNSVSQDATGAKHGLRKTIKSPAHVTRINPLIQDSKLCGTCHLNQEKFLSISAYEDWKEAFDSGKTKETCQSCHMPMHKSKMQIATGGPKRAGVRAHTFIGARDATMLKKALSLKTEAGKTADGKLRVRTTVENVGAGHKVPGSGPIRNVLLKIDAWDEHGNPLKFIGPDNARLHPLAGMGNPKTGERDADDWGGMPGKMYAKVFASRPNPQTGKPMLGVGGFAADSITFDTALKVREPDTTEYEFELPEGVARVKVQARVVYRYAFKPIIDRKGWQLDERPSLMAEKHLDVAVGELKPLQAVVLNGQRGKIAGLE